MKENKTLFDVTIGSTVYGTNTPTSDIDNKAVHIVNKFDFYTNNFEPQIIFNKDSNSYELSRFLELICVNNPTCLEMLFTPEKHIREMDTAFKVLVDNRHAFLTKMCKNTFGGYVRSQIMKATALDKKMNWEKERIERKDVLDFCYTFYNQGSTKINNWLEYRGLKQRYCGLINIPNMHDTYGLYYDFGNHIANEDSLPSDDVVLDYLGLPKGQYDIKGLINIILNTDLREEPNRRFISYIEHVDGVNYARPLCINIEELRTKLTPIGFRGIVGEDKESNEVRLSSIPKGVKPMCNMTWNKSGYNVHCKDYREYTKWLSERNTQRYVDTNKHGQMIDGKNLLHCRRLLDIAIEIATTKDIVLERPNAKELLEIRKGCVDLQTIIESAKKDLLLLDELYNNSDLPDEVDMGFVNELHYKIREEYYDSCK